MRAKVIAWTLFGAVLALSTLCWYQSVVMANQRHTIRQFMGMGLGEHDTPRPVITEN